MNKKRGFTLIELLVVISIIGLFSSIVLASLQSTREKAQIAKFKQELVQIRTALVLYRSNNNNNWPAGIEKTFVSPLLQDLKDAGVYSSNTLAVPNFIFNGVLVTPGGLNGGDASCDQPDSSNVEYVISFEFKDTSYSSQFPRFYHSGTGYIELGCINLF